MTFNPWSDRHWLKRRFFDVSNDDVLAITTNYMCNEWLDEADKRLFEHMKESNPKRYEVAGLGNWGVTGGEVAVDRATKAITDFVTLNNMFGVDMETTKFASIYGYAGRLFYIDLDCNIRVMPVHGYETIILSSTDISEPEFAVRYYEVQDKDYVKRWVV